MLRHADITSRVPEYWREKGLEALASFLSGSCSQRGAPSRGFYGKFAGILQVDIRQGGDQCPYAYDHLFVRRTFGHACHATHGNIDMRRNTECSPWHTVVIWGLRS